MCIFYLGQVCNHVTELSAVYAAPTMINGHFLGTLVISYPGIFDVHPCI